MAEEASRWRGQPGRLEVWYTTLTDPATGAGVWLHHELVAPADGSEAYGHGWVAVFREGVAPVLERFGPTRWSRPGEGFAAGEVRDEGDVLTGTAGTVSWHLTCTSSDEPVFTFPRWSWRRELLPAAQIVARPDARYTGEITSGEDRIELRDAVGAAARIYGHGNARRWVWLHADLGEGQLCEVVAAVSTRPGLRRLPPLAMVQFRGVEEADWPRDPLAAAPLLRTRIGKDRWSVRGRIGRRRVEIEVDLPPDQAVAVDYRDPDGRELVCRNSERANARISVLERDAGHWDVVRRWQLTGTAHTEVGGD